MFTRMLETTEELEVIFPIADHCTKWQTDTRKLLYANNYFESDWAAAYERANIYKDSDIEVRMLMNVDQMTMNH